MMTTGSVRGKYWVSQEVAGRGVIPTAVAMAGDYCLAVLGLHRIEISGACHQSLSAIAAESWSTRAWWRPPPNGVPRKAATQALKKIVATTK